MVQELTLKEKREEEQKRLIERRKLINKKSEDVKIKNDLPEVKNEYFEKIMMREEKFIRSRKKTNESPISLLFGLSILGFATYVALGAINRIIESTVESSPVNVTMSSPTQQLELMTKATEVMPIMSFVFIAVIITGFSVRSMMSSFGKF